MSNGFDQVVQFVQQTLAGNNRWVVVSIVALVIGIVAAVRGKVTDSWVIIPLLAIAAWYAFYRWLQLQQGN